MSGKYKKRRQDLLFELEKSKLPSTMPYVEAKLNLDKQKAELKKIKEEREKYEKIYWKLKGEETRMKNKISKFKKVI